jgi:hypothetical protein
MTTLAFSKLKTEAATLLTSHHKILHEEAGLDGKRGKRAGQGRPDRADKFSSASNTHLPNPSLPSQPLNSKLAVSDLEATMKMKSPHNTASYDAGTSCY